MRLGTALFVRHPRSLALTDAGRKLLPEVGSALEALAAAAGRADASAPGDVLTVATSVSVAQWVIAPNLADFTTRNPEISVRLLSAIWPDDFHASQADVQVRFGSEKQVGRGAERLRPDRLVALKGADACRGSVRPSPDRSSRHVQWMEDVVRQAGRATAACCFRRHVRHGASFGGSWQRGCPDQRIFGETCDGNRSCRKRT